MPRLYLLRIRASKGVRVAALQDRETKTDGAASATDRRGANIGPYARGWALAMPCWGVLQQGNELIVFRVVSTIGVLIVTASLVVPGFFTGLWQGVADNGAGAGLWILKVLFCLVEYLVIIF